MQSSVLEILHNPNENGITIFILGVLFVLSVYHFLLYFQHKDKVYLYYSLYTFLIFINHLNDSSFGFISTLIKPYIGILNYYDYPLMWLYNTVYFVFGFTFLNLKSYSKAWYSFIFNVISVLLITIFITVSLATISGNKIIYLPLALIWFHFSLSSELYAIILFSN